MSSSGHFDYTPKDTVTVRAVFLGHLDCMFGYLLSGLKSAFSVLSDDCTGTSVQLDRCMLENRFRS